MNKKIIEQLKKCSIPLPEYSEETKQLIIPKDKNYQKISAPEDFAIGTNYLIQVNKSLVYPCDWYYTIHSNWNQGIGPTEEYLYINIISKIGKMLKVSSIGYNNRQTWIGWLPQTNITILERM